jgi:hypothetical protein
MDKVEDLMRGLKLSELESRGLKIGWSDGKKVGMVEPQAMGKLFSDKPSYVDAMETALGRIWCPMRGIRCKEMGENLFLFTFTQESEKKKALFDGPWQFNKSLLVLQDFDPCKTLDEYNFSTIPVWIRIFGLPLGSMNRDTGILIADEVGEYMEADVGEDGMAMGNYLRIKIRIKIRNPLIRGITLERGEGRDGLWCRFEYEFLPDFCFRCGMLDHIERECKIILAKGDNKQFGSWLRAYIPRSNSTEQSRGAWVGGRRIKDRLDNGSNKNFCFNTHRGKSGSDSDNWRRSNNGKLQLYASEERVDENANDKEQQQNVRTLVLVEEKNKQIEENDKGGEENADGGLSSQVVHAGEVSADKGVNKTSVAPAVGPVLVNEKKSQKNLELSDTTKKDGGQKGLGEEYAEEVEMEIGTEERGGDVESSLEGQKNDAVNTGVGKEAVSNTETESQKKQRKFRRVKHVREEGKSVAGGALKQKKRGADDMEVVEELEVQKAKMQKQINGDGVPTKTMEAGLSEQLRRAQ